MPWISLDTAASSAVSGEIDPEVKKSTKDLVVDVEFQARAYFQGQMLLQKEEESRQWQLSPTMVSLKSSKPLPPIPLQLYRWAIRLTEMLEGSWTMIDYYD